MRQLPDVAVIIPLFNGAAWIQDTLKAVLSQRHCPREVVVVDDGSTDGSPGLVKAFPDVQLVRNPDKGTNSARRFGQAQTTAPLLTFLDQDDLWHCDHLVLMATAMAENPDATAAVSKVQVFVDGMTPRFDAPVLDLVWVDPWESYPKTFTVTPSSVVIRRSALEEVGGWTQDYVGVADFYMWLRLSERRLLILNRCVTTGFRSHHTSQNVHLRSNETSRFVRNKVQAAVCATRHREAAHPEEALSLERKRRLVQAFEALLNGLLERDAIAVARTAVLLEVAAEGEHDDQIRRVLGGLFYYLGPLMQQPEVFVVTWDLLLKEWPRSATRTGRLLRERAPRWNRRITQRIRSWWKKTPSSTGPGPRNDWTSTR